MTLEIIGIMAVMGYKSFNPKKMFLPSSRTYNPATLENKMNDPKIYNLFDEDNNHYKYWSNTEILFDPESETTPLKPKVWINEKGFIAEPIKSKNEILTCKRENCFKRPAINGLDDKLDLGDLNFAISDAGVLFSYYEFVEHKICDSFDEQLQINYDVKNYVYRLQETTIGTLSWSGKVQSVHVFPKK
jgi:hypothetical protein